MCAEGKTLIDQVKHQFLRVVSLVLISAMREKTLSTPALRDFLNIPFIQKHCIEKVRNALHTAEALAFEAQVKTGKVSIETYYGLSNALEHCWSVKRLGLYELHFATESEAEEEYKKFLLDIKKCVHIKIMNGLKSDFQAFLSEECSNLYVRESATKDRYYPVDSVAFNWSKMNNLHRRDAEGAWVETKFRGPFHNTKKPAATAGDRIVKLLVEVDLDVGERGVNAHIKKTRKPGEHADHIFPLSLGGKHSLENIMMLPGAENLEKKAHLTFEAYSLALDNMSAIICKESHEVFIKFSKIIKNDPVLFKAYRLQFEQELRHAKQIFCKSFSDMSLDLQMEVLRRKRPDMSPKQHKRFCERFARKEKKTHV